MQRKKKDDNKKKELSGLLLLPSEQTSGRVPGPTEAHLKQPPPRPSITFGKLTIWAKLNVHSVHLRLMHFTVNI